MFEDDAARLEKAAIYLNKWKESIKKVVGVESPNEMVWTFERKR